MKANKKTISTGEPKKEYHPPSVMSYGELKNLTLGGASENADSGSGFLDSVGG